MSPFSFLFPHRQSNYQHLFHEFVNLVYILSTCSEPGPVLGTSKAEMKAPRAPYRVGKWVRKEVGKRQGRHTLTKVVTPQAPTVGCTVPIADKETKAKIERTS